MHKLTNNKYLKPSGQVLEPKIRNIHIFTIHHFDPGFVHQLALDCLSGLRQFAGSAPHVMQMGRDLDLQIIDGRRQSQHLLERGDCAALL